MGEVSSVIGMSSAKNSVIGVDCLGKRDHCLTNDGLHFFVEREMHFAFLFFNVVFKDGLGG